LTRFERTFRLSNKAGDFGLACQLDTGLSLAGVQLLRRTPSGFSPRPLADLGPLMKGAYAEAADPERLVRGLGVVADALNRGDIGRAMIAALHMRLPDLDAAGAARIAEADEVLAKYSPDEPRDERGRWTTGGAARTPPSVTSPSGASASARAWGEPGRLYGGRIIPVAGGPVEVTAEDPVQGRGMGDNNPPEAATGRAPGKPGQPRTRLPQASEPASPPLGYIPGDPFYPMNDGVRWSEATHDLILKSLMRTGQKDPQMVIFVPLHGKGPILTGPDQNKDYPTPEGYFPLRLIGIPQVTRPIGRPSFHAHDSVDEALGLADTKQFGTMYFNSAWSKLTKGEIRSLIRHDVVAVVRPGVDIDFIYHPAEVLSPGQTREQQKERIPIDPRINPELRTKPFRSSSYRRSPYFEYFDTPLYDA
jgi:hypothetical protein